MDFTEVINSRESIRDYDPARKVEPAVLERILQAGRIAPSATNRQPWKFLLVSSPEYLVRVKACYQRPWLADAPHILVVKGKIADAWVRKQDGYNSLETDLTIAMDHMILAAENEGLGSCWIEAFDPAMLSEVLGLEPGEKVFAMTPLGYPKNGFTKKGPAGKARKPLNEIVEYL